MPWTTIRAGAVATTALALAATTLTALPAAGADLYLEPTVTLAEGPAESLRVDAVDVTDGVVRWLDASEAAVPLTSDLWSRDLSDDAARSPVVRGTAGWSLAADGDVAYVVRATGTGDATSYELVRVTGSDDVEVLAPLEWPGRVSAGAGRVAVAGHHGSVVVDVASGAVTEAPTAFMTVAGPWDVTIGQVSDLSDGTAGTRIVGTSGTTERVVEIPGAEVTAFQTVGTRVVLQFEGPRQGAGLQTGVFDLADAAGPHLNRLSVPVTQRLLAAGPGRIVTKDDLSEDLLVRSIHDGTVLARVATGMSDPVVALDGSWITWTTSGPDGDRLVAAPLAGSLSPTFTDVDADHPFRTEIAWLVDNGIAEGYVDGSFGAVAPVSRQAMAAFLYRAAGKPDFTAPTEASFSDVPTTHPFFREIEWLADSEVAGGYTDGTFKPTAPVSRQAMAAFLHRFAGEPEVPADAPTFRDVPAGNQFRDAIRWLAATEVTTGYADDTFRPTTAVSRQAMAAFLYRYDKLEG